MGKKRTRRRLRVLFISAVIGAIAAGIVGGVLPKLEIAMSQSSPSPSASKPVPTPSPTPIASVELPCAVGQRAIEALLLTLGMVTEAIKLDQFDWIPEEMNRSIIAYEELRVVEEEDFTQRMLIDIALANLKGMSKFIADRPYLSRADKLTFVAIWRDSLSAISAPINTSGGEGIREEYVCPQ
jgi:hypothetical protein